MILPSFILWLYGVAFSVQLPPLYGALVECSLFGAVVYIFDIIE